MGCGRPSGGAVRSRIATEEKTTDGGDGDDGDYTRLMLAANVTHCRRVKSYGGKRHVQPPPSAARDVGVSAVFACRAVVAVTAFTTYAPHDPGERFKFFLSSSTHPPPRPFE